MYFVNTVTTYAHLVLNMRILQDNQRLEWCVVGSGGATSDAQVSNGMDVR